MGLAKTSAGAVVFAEYGTGNVYAAQSDEVTQIASNLDKPTGVAVDNSDIVYVSERGSGRIIRIDGSKSDTLVDDLINPQGLAVRGDTLYVIDTGSKELLAIDTGNGSRSILASNLPVGAPPGVIPKPLMSVGDMSGPMTDFTGLAIDANGTLYIAGDAEGAVLALRPTN